MGSLVEKNAVEAIKLIKYNFKRTGGFPKSMKGIIQFTMIPKDALRVSIMYLTTEVNRLLVSAADLNPSEEKRKQLYEILTVITLG